MALKQGLSGPRPVAWYLNEAYRLTFKNLPEMRLKWWEVQYRGAHVGDIFQGKSGKVFVVFFGRGAVGQFGVPTLADAMQHIAGVLLHWRN
jgi:hypothetical protein